MRAEIAVTAARTREIARLIEERSVVSIEMGMQIAAGMKKPAGVERFWHLTRAIARLVAGKSEEHGRTAMDG